MSQLPAMGPWQNCAAESAIFKWSVSAYDIITTVLMYARRETLHMGVKMRRIMTNRIKHQQLESTNLFISIQSYSIYSILINPNIVSSAVIWLRDHLSRGYDCGLLGVWNFHGILSHSPALHLWICSKDTPDPVRLGLLLLRFASFDFIPMVV